MCSFSKQLPKQQERATSHRCEDQGHIDCLKNQDSGQGPNTEAQRGCTCVQGGCHRVRGSEQALDPASDYFVHSDEGLRWTEPCVWWSFDRMQPDLCQRTGERQRPLRCANRRVIAGQFFFVLELAIGCPARWHVEEGIA